MSWNETIARLYKEHDYPVVAPYRLEHPFNAALINALFRMFRDETWESIGDLRSAVVSTWVETASPTTLMAPDVWREMFAVTGQIEHGRYLPTEPMAVYRSANIESSKGWSWAVDPSCTFHSPLMPKPSRVDFDLAMSRMPDMYWWKTTVQPEQILITTAFGHPTTRSGVVLRERTTDEIVIDPRTIEHIERVPIEEIRAYFDDPEEDRA
ncbi:hypothetical protein [Lacisediminihabitans sp. H27-G8]|uniref:hypothetical protein n=1 Tax=Lacisediminihabitans sp. H27-G8 TaxID=3111909 RepID=UPI0038FBEE21